MDQAKYYICTACFSGVPSGHKFCGRCGGPVPEEALSVQTSFFSDMQNPAKARLILIHGEDLEPGMEPGLSYHLKAEQHILGRSGQLEIAQDRFISDIHANFFYRDAQLTVRDEGSVNGVYVRIRGTVDLTVGDMFIAGRHVFRLDMTPPQTEVADAEGTYFYASPRYQSAFRVNEILEGGAIGTTICARGSSLSIGREDCDMNFLGDRYLNAQHCTVDEGRGRYTLTDHGSKNGTYLRIKTEFGLSHGDYVGVGRKLLRVEVNA